MAQDNGERSTMEVWNEYTADDVAQHHTQSDCWLIIGPDGAKKVYDVTAFLEDHPGGPELLLDLAGQDVQDEFEDIGHTNDARKMLEELCIGVLKEDPSASLIREAKKLARLSLLTHPELGSGTPQSARPSLVAIGIAMAGVVAICAALLAHWRGYSSF